ncbi:uncharacterized protein LOC133193894 [Saccostrea echinata]|uniref:uncharacterized protein LOC133193894 n=1 Tax=Saccostrea echinata TaxID=191078 RepID=UPI002A81CD32|nr:uncharacterized protein LOC133193894 [Saccostrea echinata]
MGISTVLLLVLLGTGVGAIKPTKPHSVKPIPPRESADPSEGKRIERDGNCFYRSLSLYRYHSQENYRFVRQEIMNFMSNREDRYAGLIDRNQDYAGYIRNHRQDCVWAEDAMVQAAADLYGINIFVSYYGMNGEMSQPLQVIRARSEQNSPMWLHLRLQGSHYDIINDDSKEGALEPVCKFDLLSIQDPKEIEALKMFG